MDGLMDGQTDEETDAANCFNFPINAVGKVKYATSETTTIELMKTHCLPFLLCSSGAISLSCSNVQIQK